MNKNDKINEWAEQFSFSQLKEAEQQTVLHQMSVEEYDDIHYTLIQFGTFLREEKESLEPESSSFAVLADKLDQRSKPTIWASILAIKIPAYQAAAACFIAALCTYLLFGKTTTNTVVVEKEVPVYELVRDTIFIEVPIVEYVTKTVIRNVPKTEDTKTISTDYTPQENYAQRQPTAIPSKEDLARSFGNTPVNAESLEKFKVRM